MLYGGFTLLKKSMICDEAKASPTRSPASPQAFEKVCKTTMFGMTLISETNDFSCEKWTYASSITKIPSKFDASFRTASRSIELPVGLLGEQIKISLV